MSNNIYSPNYSQIFLFADGQIRDSLTKEKLLENNIINQSSKIISDISEYKNNTVYVFNIDQDYVLHVADSLVVVDCRKDDSAGRKWLKETAEKIISIYPEFDYKGLGVSLHFSFDFKVIKINNKFLDPDNISGNILVHQESSINNSLLNTIIEEDENSSIVTLRYHHDFINSKDNNIKCSKLITQFDNYMKDFNVRIKNIHKEF